MFLVYRITNNINGHYYIGKASIAKWDKGYCGSGKLILRAIKKYGKKNFTRKVLFKTDNEQAAYAYEASVVTQQQVSDPKCYNMMLGGFGTPKGENNALWGKKFTLPPEHIRKGQDHPMFGVKGEDHPRYGLPRPDVAERNKKNSGINSPVFGKPGYWTGKTRPKHSKTTLDKLSGKNHYNYGKKQSAATKAKVQETKRMNTLIRQQVALEHTYPITTENGIA